MTHGLFRDLWEGRMLDVKRVELEENKFKARKAEWYRKRLNMKDNGNKS